MTVFIQIGIAACIVIYASIYLIGMWRGHVRPVMATWLFFTLATVLSFITDYSQTGTAGLAANSFNIFDTVACTTIFIVTLFQPAVRKQFNTLEKWCIGAVVIVFVCWLLSDQNVLAHLSIQIILFIAYIPTMTHLLHAAHNTESLWSWTFDCLASILGFTVALRTVDLLPLVYTGRSILCTGLVVVLILRLKWRNTSST